MYIMSFMTSEITWIWVIQTPLNNRYFFNLTDGGNVVIEPSFRPGNFMLIPTAACQASCAYCFGPNRGETMSVGIADQALAFMARIAPAEGSVHVTFHGG